MARRWALPPRGGARRQRSVLVVWAPIARQYRDDDPAFDLYPTDVAHSGARSPRHGGGGGRELLYSFRGDGADRPLALPGDFAACVCRLFRLRLRLLRPV